MNFTLNGNISCNVFNGDAFVGVLTRIPGRDKLTIFDYDVNYDGPPLAPSLPKDEGPIESKGLHKVFRNLVSEGWLHDAQKKVLAAYGVDIGHFDVLAHFGSDCIGAIRVVPWMDLPTEKVRALDGMDEVLANRNGALIPGVQPKFLSTMDEDGFFIATRKTGSTHIVKVQGPHFAGIIENEFVTMNFVKALLPEDHTSNVKLISISRIIQHKQNDLEGHALVIERFDRDSNGNPIPLFEFTQLLNVDPDDKYEGSFTDMADFIHSHKNGQSKDGIKTNELDIVILYKRILASILLENGDAHLKNFALLRQGDEYRLSPNYDIVTQSRKGDKMALAIAGDKKMFICRLQPHSLFELAQEFGIVSKKPTAAEINKLSEIIHDVGDRAERLSKIRKDPSIANEFPTLKKRVIDRADELGIGTQLQTTFRTLQDIHAALFKRMDRYLSKVEVFDASPNAAAQPPAMLLAAPCGQSMIPH